MRLAALALLGLLIGAAPAAALTFDAPAAEGAERAKVPPPKQKRAANVGQKAIDSLTVGSLKKALTLTRKALKLDPDSPEGLFAAGMLLLRNIEAGTAEDPETERALAGALFRRLLEIDPAGMYAAIASSAADGAPAQPVLSDPDPPCDEESQAHWNQAEAHLAAGRHEDAVVSYDLAIRGCPGNARLRLYSGDAVFAQGDLGGALLRYEAALSIEPCYWVAHRFAGDVHFQSGRPLEGVGSLVRSVACNPWYEPGRRFFQDMAAGLELPLVWPPERGPRITNDGGKLDISVVNVEEEHETASSAWLMYGLMKAGLADPDMAESMAKLLENWPKGVSELSPLTVEVTSLALALEVFRDESGELTIPEHPETTFWALIAEAEAADRLREAAFFLIADPWLAPEFAAVAATPDGRDRLNLFVHNLLLGGGNLVPDGAPSGGEDAADEVTSPEAAGPPGGTDPSPSSPPDP